MENNISNPFYDLETEEIVIGALIVEQGAILEVIDILTPDMFSDWRCKAIYSFILDLHDKNEVVDLITLSSALSKLKNNEFEKIGGFVHLSMLTTKVASSSHIQRHAMIISQFSYARKLFAIFETHRMLIMNNDFKDINDVSLSATEQLDQINSTMVRNGMLRISDTLAEAQKAIYNRLNAFRSNKFVGIPSGLISLDILTGGWQGNQLVVIAGRPAMGKTALLLHFATHASIAKAHVCIYSLEMGTTSLLDRMIHRNTEIDEYVYKKGCMTDLQMQEVEQSIGKLQQLDIYIDDKPSCNIRYIRTNAKMQHKQGKCDMIIIDYLQIMDVLEAGRHREQEVSNTTRGLKKLAKELNIPIIALAQLGRGVESRPDKIPMLSDLRESGAIEQDADIVAFIYRPKVYGIDTVTYGAETIDTTGYGEIIIAKQRDGGIGKVQFSHNPSLTKITEYKQSFMPSMADPPLMPQTTKSPF